MTRLRRRIRRLVTIEIKHGSPEDIVLTVYPGALLGFRHPRSRRELLLDFRSTYLLAAKKAADERMQQRMIQHPAVAGRAAPPRRRHTRRPRPFHQP